MPQDIKLCVSIDRSDNRSMSEIGTDLYSGTIPACPKGTTITYVIVAQDSLGNSNSSSASGYVLTYTVVPEFPSFLILLLFFMATLLAVIVYQRRRMHH